MSQRALIDFAGLAKGLLDRAESLVPQWLPGGKTRGHEYVCSDLGGGDGSSLSVNLSTGLWADFSGDDSGGDLIALYAAIHGLSQIDAARALMDELGWQQAAPTVVPLRPAVARAAGDAAQGSDERPEPPAEDAAGKPGARRKSLWRAMVPVPASAPACDFWHYEYKQPECTWSYEFEGVLYGHVARFRTSTGGKDVLPYTWCVDESDDRGTMRWHSKQWDEPRPLYVPATLLSGTPADVPVVLVEGEKCALAGHVLLGHEFDFVSWPGGGNAWNRAAWGWLMGRTVYLWPDCDGKRKKLTREQREANADPASMPLLPEAMQPGMRAMLNIGSLLVAEQGCTVLMCKMPKPGDVGDGWDVADAIDAGWDAAMVRGFIRSASTFSPPDEAAAAKVATAKTVSTPSIAGATRDDAATAWRGSLLMSSQGSIKAVRENVVLALDGIPDAGLAGIAECVGVIGFNEFTNDVVKLKPSPWGTPAGVWDEVDDLLMGEWLTREHWLPSMPRGTLEEAVRMVAYRHRYHPVRAEFNALRGTHDGQKRLGSWLRRCCLVEDEYDDVDPLQQYLARVGTWLVMAIVARVLTPGCKFDSMVIFEGAQGVGKSTLASVLGGDYYADTGLVLGDKDSFQNLQGISVYEFGELDALNKSEVTKVKMFISSMKDRFRASFDRRAKDYPRQVVFVGTTNEDHYLTDPTGNRRMWPVRVTRQIDLAWLRKNRAQLFAEALAYVDAGERFHPSAKEQRELFEPQQQKRAVENAIESAITRYLYDEKQIISGSGENGSLVDEVTLIGLLGKLGIGLEKLGPGRFHEKQAASALRRLGWTEARSSEPGRPRVYRRPIAQPLADASGSQTTTTNLSTRPTQGDDHRGVDDCPF